eukprot:3354085-Amphidinium_carterae.1
MHWSASAQETSSILLPAAWKPFVLLESQSACGGCAGTFGSRGGFRFGGRRTSGGCGVWHSTETVARSLRCASSVLEHHSVSSMLLNEAVQCSKNE